LPVQIACLPPDSIITTINIILFDESVNRNAENYRNYWDREELKIPTREFPFPNERQIYVFRSIRPLIPKH
jgi:hypothetical protein